ncbi:MAG: helix-turn-helix transcriptional regulator [Bacteroidales bacterium]
MKMIIKNMMCYRCIMAVEAEATRSGLKPVKVALGELTLEGNDIPGPALVHFDEALRRIGLERLDNSKNLLVEKIKQIVIENVHQQGPEMKWTWSERIASQLNYDYNYLSNLFSAAEGITLEQFIIRQKIERVKELLSYGELSVSQIAWELGYNSAAYLSNQFKKVTGYTPGQFRQTMPRERLALDHV